MHTRGYQLDSFVEISRQLRVCAWDVFNEWHAETALSPADELSGLDAELLDQLPTLIGGIAKIINDPLFLLDLEAGGRLHETAEKYGRLRQEAGFQINRVLNDFSLLREKLCLFCERNVSTHDHSLFELERRINLTLDRMILVAVEAFHKRASAELIETAQKDKLTGFLHVKAFYSALESEVARAKRYRYAVSLICADVDNFGEFNSEAGQFEGNRFLKEMTRQISDVTRGTDRVARLGGDEFAVIMPQTKLQNAKIGAERIRRQVRGVRRDEQRMTVSIGISVFPQAEDAVSLIELAKKNMAWAQKQGGDVIRSQSA